jgi:hypothetical protein
MLGRTLRRNLGQLGLVMPLIKSSRTHAGNERATQRPARGQPPAQTKRMRRHGARAAHLCPAPGVNALAEVGERLVQLHIVVRIVDTKLGSFMSRTGAPRLLFVFAVKIHRLPPNSALTRATARDRCAFTVPSLRLVVCAISARSISSTCRSRKTVRCRSLNPFTACHTRSTCSRASNLVSAELSPLGSQSLASSTSTELVRVSRQNCIRRLRQWSFCRLMAIRISHVIALDSPLKLAQFLCAFRKQSCVKVSARSESRVDASRNRKICGRCFVTTVENSSAADSSAVAMVTVSIIVPAAITLVDARTAGKFTRLAGICGDRRKRRKAHAAPRRPRAIRQGCRLGHMRTALLAFVILATARLPAQEPAASQLPPSEELKAATAPLAAARSQPDDMTQADLAAYSVGISRAGRACLRLDPAREELAKAPDELLSLARLCNFGQQYEPARRAAMRYLELPAPAERERALLVLVQAFLGEKDIVNSAAQIFSVRHDYPYDAKVHFAMDEVISAGALLNNAANGSAIALCNDQLSMTLPMLEGGKGLEGKDSTVPPSMLYADAVRCVEIERALGEKSAQATLARLDAIAALPQWQHTAELAPMQSALARARMVGQPAPRRRISGKVVHAAAPLRPATISLARGTVLLIPFTLWSPSAVSIVRDLHVTEPQQPIYLLTSWAANTGAADEESKEILGSLRFTAQSLPDHVSLAVVPDAVLEEMHADAFPAAIVVCNGVVQANLPLIGEAATRISVLALGQIAPEAASTRHPHQ